MRERRGIRITNIVLGKKAVPVDFTVRPGETFTLEFDGSDFVVVRQLRFPVGEAVPIIKRRNGRRRKYKARQPKEKIV